MIHFFESLVLGARIIYFLSDFTMTPCSANQDQLQAALGGHVKLKTGAEILYGGFLSCHLSSLSDNINFMRVVIVMPTYNEAQNIGGMIDLVCGEVCRRISQVDMHLLVADDNSPDGTGRIVRKRMKRYANLHLSSGIKRSLGRAYVRGIRHALEMLAPDALVEMDADFQHDPGYLPQMVAAFRDGADYVIGSRFIPGGSIPDAWVWYRRAISRLGNSFARYMLDIDDLHDFTTGYRLTRVNGVLDQIDLQHLRCLDRFAYKVDLLYKTAKKAAKIVEIPICFAARRHENSKFQIAEIMATLQVILLLKLEDNRLVQNIKKRNAFST
jgi:dolichol-phosphate mannosyltransferase